MSTSEELKRAYRLIKRDQLEEAQTIIRPILNEEPDNADAWWLLAYADDDPGEVRHALTRVLEIDPNYSNASKAREMLARLDEQFPTEPEPVGLDNPFDTDVSNFGSDDVLGSSPFDEPGSLDTFDAYEDSFNQAFAEPEEDFLATEDLFADIEDVVDVPVEPISRPLRKEELQASLEPAAPLDPETRAVLEERAARRQGRGGRLLRLALITITIPILVVVALFLLFPSDDDEERTDPGQLRSVAVQSDAIDEIVISTGSEVRLANLSSESQVIVAQTQAGETLFVQVCTQPGPHLPMLAMRGMEIAARQAPALEGELAAVGVSVNLCGSPEYDSLYRAYVPLEDAIRYTDGDLGDGAVGQAAFQGLWKTF